ncbi:MAG: glutamine synthetase family protein [Polyangiaceae bacterium]
MAKKEPVKRVKGRARRRAKGDAGRALIDVAALAKQGVKRAKIGGFDLDGVLRGKYVSLAKLESVSASGFGFCDVIFGWDVADVLYDNSKVTGWHTGYPDAHAVLDPSTLRVVPWEPGVVALLADFRDADGGRHPACPRSLLRSVIERAQRAGFEAKFGAEFEFYFFRETRDSLADKAFRGLRPLDPGMFGYSWVRAGQDSELMRDLMDGLAAFGIEIEGLHTETGPGVYEAAIRYDDALAAADKAALFKTAVKQIAHRHGISVTFMAKWNASLPGSSGHLHQSLWRDGKNAFFDPKAERGMSRVMRGYIAGQMALMRELTAMYSPTINSYKRYVPGVWAPIVPSWGVDNRTCAIRVLELGNSKAQRIEYRQTAADMNPYVAMAACLGAGLHGVEHELELPAETSGDAGSEGPDRLPRTLREAAALLSDSSAAKSLFGEEFVDHYVRTRDWEVRAFERAVTDWELERYFEVI